MLQSLRQYDINSHNFSIYVLVAAVAILLTGIIKRLYVAFVPPVSAPGPFLARFTRLWEMAAVYPGDFQKTNMKLHDKYGPVVRLAPNRYSIADPEANKTILGHGRAFSKSPFYEPFGNPGEHGLFNEPNSAQHANLRRHMSMLYSTSSLLQYEPFVDNCNSILESKFRQFAQTHQKVRMCEYFQFYAFDVIAEITAGARFDFMETEGDPMGIIDAIHGVNVTGHFVGLIPETHSLTLGFGTLLGKLTGAKPPFTSMVEFVQTQIDRRLAQRGDHSDFLNTLLHLEESGKNTRFHTWNVSVQNIAAGSDTTAISLSSVIYHLLKYPTAMAKLRQEISEGIAFGKISNPITYTEAQALPYLQAVITEAVRVHPAVGTILARVVPKGGATIAGHYFPEGVSLQARRTHNPTWLDKTDKPLCKTEVGVNPWVIHYDKAVFGDDAHEFRPERWLEDSSQKSWLNQNFLGFGAGARTCIGKNISLLELSKVIPQLLRNFDFKLVEPEKEWETCTRWFVKPEFECLISER